MLRLQRFSYFLQLLESPNLSAFSNSDGKFSFIDDEGLEDKEKKIIPNFLNCESSTYERRMWRTCPTTPLFSRKGYFAVSQIAKSKHFLPSMPFLNWNFDITGLLIKKIGFTYSNDSLLNGRIPFE